MNQPITIEQIQLEGFRAYLQPQTIGLRTGKTPRSLAIFAPNAKGKSGLIDAFEHFFSSDGTLKRLGRIAANTNAGPHALEHVDAEKTGITPKVHFWFRRGTESFDATRTQSDSLPDIAAHVLASAKVQFIIRGYELRRFVENASPGEQYRELASWFAFEPLLTVQENLKRLRDRLNERIRSTEEVDERTRDVARITNGMITVFDEVKLGSWINDEVLVHLDDSLKVDKLSEQDPGFLELEARSKTEQEQVGLSQLRRIRGQIGAVFSQDGEDLSGSLVSFENSVSEYRKAVSDEANERSKEGNAIFLQVWSEAQNLLAKDIEIVNCPICDTEFPSSPPGSRDEVHINLRKKLSELSDYRKAEKQLKDSSVKLGNNKEKLKRDLDLATTSLKDNSYSCPESIAFVEFLGTWKFEDNAPKNEKIRAELLELSSLIGSEIVKIEQSQGEHTYSKALDMVRELIVVKTDLERIERVKTELGRLSEELDRQSMAIDEGIAYHIRSLIVKLQEKVSLLYSEIQGEHERLPEIRLVLSDQGQVNQRQAQLRIDFAENRKEVAPSGYLSDSQVHTLALAHRLAAMLMFNERVPIIVLDDVVTSYDADHRRTIAGVLSKYFADFQVIIVTHDEQFFNFMKDQLPQSRWDFKRITEVRDGFGPVFHDHRTRDEVIDNRLNSGKSAAREMRQAEEEWLLDICRDFATRITIRTIERAYQYDRSELASSLASFLKERKINPPLVPGVSNTFLSSLEKGVIENFASHFDDNPQKTESIGDERARWKEFKYFRDLFKCPSCCGRRFKRAYNQNKPVCRHKKCEAQFAFPIPAPTATNSTSSTQEIAT